MKNLFKAAVLFLAFIALSFVPLEKETITVVIDASHGGHDFGANHDEFYEKEISNVISKKIEALNKNKNVKIFLTRTNDEFVELRKRVEFINNIKPDLVISLHVNKSKNLSTNGFEAFISEKSTSNEKSNEKAKKLVDDFEKNTPLKNRGIKIAPFFVLKNSEVPAIILEIGYISNENDRKYITNEKGQDEIAKTILNFISDLD